MRIRLPFAAVFLALLVVGGYGILATFTVGPPINDKLLHFVGLFALTLVFYWVLETSRRRALNLTLAVCTTGLAVGSEFAQSFLSPRRFDIYDIVANVAGSLLAVALCSWYHKRMLNRRRLNRAYRPVPGEDTVDLELGEGGHSPVAALDVDGPTGNEPADPPPPVRSLEDEVDRWDENAVQTWDGEEDSEDDTSAKGKPSNDAGTGAGSA